MASTPTIASAHEICRRGTKAEVLKVIKRLKDKDRINEKDQDYEQTLLHILSENGRLDLCIFLIDKCRAGVNEVDKSGWTPLHSAASSGHIDVLEALLQRGAFVRALTDEQASALHYFVRNSCSDPAVLHRVISAFVAKGADLNQKNKHGETALHQAAMRGRAQCLLCLLNFKADVNSITTHGETPLHFAVRAGHKDCMNILLQMSADPTISSATTGSPLDIAAQRNDAEMIEMIRSHYKDFGQEPPPVPRTSATAAAAPAASPALSSARNETHERRPSGHSHVTKPSSGSEGPTPDHHSSGKRLSGVDIHGERDVEDRTDTEFDDDDDDDLIDVKRSTSDKSLKGKPDALGRKRASYQRQRSSSVSAIGKADGVAHPRTGSRPPAVQQSTLGDGLLPTSTSNPSVSHEQARLLRASQPRTSSPIAVAVSSPPTSRKTSAPNIPSSPSAGRVGNLRAKFEQYGKDPSPPNSSPMRSRIKSAKGPNESSDSSDNEKTPPATPPVQRAGHAAHGGTPTSTSTSTSTATSPSVSKSELDPSSASSTDSESASQPDVANVTTVLALPQLQVATQELLQNGTRCGSCSKTSPNVPLAFFARGPVDWENITADRAKRSKLSSDLCSIDNISFFMRGLLPIRIRLPEPVGAATPAASTTSSATTTTSSTSSTTSTPTGAAGELVFTWGVWVKVATQHFYEIMEGWSSKKQAIYPGVLNTRLPLYPNTLDIKVELVLSNNGQRPSIRLLEREHELCKDWQDGMSLSRFEALIAALSPSDRR